tara:strand:+ start:633 stop:845 length:213 start_codon:yes stop_codon:yes gene_type:complete
LFKLTAEGVDICVPQLFSQRADTDLRFKQTTLSMSDAMGDAISHGTLTHVMRKCLAEVFVTHVDLFSDLL